MQSDAPYYIYLWLSGGDRYFMPYAKAEAWGLAKIILPAEVCKALVTTTRNSPPT
jgi:hypothetical protein